MNYFIQSKRLASFVATGIVASAFSVQASTVVTETFDFTGAEQTFIVQAGVTSIDFEVLGGRGGDGGGFGGFGGFGFFVTGQLSVTNGSLTIRVAGAGGNGFDDGGNGGLGGMFGGASGTMGFSSIGIGFSGGGGSGGGGGGSSILLGSEFLLTSSGGGGGSGGEGSFGGGGASVGGSGSGTGIGGAGAFGAGGSNGMNGGGGSGGIYDPFLPSGSNVDNGGAAGTAFTTHASVAGVTTRKATSADYASTSGNGKVVIKYIVGPIPEPSSALLLVMGGFGLIFTRRRVK